VRSRTISTLVVVALFALLAPAASADVCIGLPACPGGGGSSGGRATPLNRIAISDGVPGIAAQAVDEPGVEGSASCHLTIHRLKPRRGNSTVSWHTKDGSATHNNQGKNGPDYEANAGAVTFSAEQPSAIGVDVQIDQDFLPAGSPDEKEFEDFFVVLTNPRNGVIVDHSGRCVIHDTSPV